MRHALFACLALALLAGCRRGGPAPDAATGHLTGTLTLADTLGDVRRDRFSALVLSHAEMGADTLARAPFDSLGHFSFDVAAPARGVYPLVVQLDGRPVQVHELVVAGGDTARAQFYYPATLRLARIRSRENDAWTAYRNARAGYQNALRSSLGQPDALARMRDAALLTANILWSLRDGFPGTVAEELGAAEGIALLDGWDDSLLVARAEQIEGQSAGFVMAAQAARRAQARQAGQGAAVRLLESFIARTGDEEKKAALQAEIVTARLDSLQADGARAAARKLQQTYPNSPWAEWASRAEYEATTLLPGQQAPPFDLTTRAGQRVRLDSLQGQTVVLEFFSPLDEGFARQFQERAALETALARYPVRFVAVSLERDSLTTRAFFSQSPLRGAQVEAPGGFESAIARQYNVRALPTRFLIGPDGRILARYTGPLVPQLTQDLLTLLGITPTPKPPL